MAEIEELGYHMGAEYVMIMRTRDLYVLASVSFCWPNECPPRQQATLSERCNDERYSECEG